MPKIFILGKLCNTIWNDIVMVLYMYAESVPFSWAVERFDLMNYG